MKIINIKSAALGAALMAATIAPVHASIIISEVAPWSSGNSPFAADWFELTNTGSSAVSISGWKMDDNSNSFASAVTLTGVASIAAGQSVIFTEAASSTNTSFISLWLGATPPATLTIGNYSGSGVGLGAGGDAVNIYNAGGTLQANVSFGASDATSPYQTFDNAAGLNNTVISLLSVTGVNGAFIAANDLTEIGSPGTISAVPVPAAVWLFGSALAGLGVVGKRRKVESY